MLITNPIQEFKDNKITLSELRNNILKTDISSFIAKSFTTVDTGTEYMHNWHIDLIAYHLQNAYNGDTKRIIINIPPRSLKSVCVSVAWPAWILGNNPSARVIVASYSDTLSTKHSTDSRLIINSKWYKQVFPEFKLSRTQNEKHKFATTMNGYRFATSVGGTLTGEGGNFLIIDDPHNPLQVLSDKHRNRVLSWFDSTFSTRLNDKKKGVIIVVMQRLHENDLTGYLLNKKNASDWEHINIPAIANEDEIISIGSRAINRKQGDLLHPNREGAIEIERAKNELGSFFFAAQYQQDPISEDGGMVKREWFKSYPIDKKYNFSSITLSFDTGIKANNNNDPTVCTVWGELGGDYYLLDIYREWLEYPDLKRESIRLVESWDAGVVLIEDKASGQSLIQDLRAETSFNIIGIKVNKDKITRFASISTMIESGRVYLPYNAYWLGDFLSEVLKFPNSQHDDQVDSTSQFLEWIKGRKGMNGDRFNIRCLSG